MKKIAYIRKGPFPHANKAVAKLLKEEFPEYEVEVINVKKDFIKARKLLILSNIWFTLKEYGLDILLGKKKLKSCFFKTTFILKKIKQFMSKRLSKDKYVFSLQIQSLFDASVEGIPHFVYTDHTHLANLLYPNADPNKLLYTQDWLNQEKTIYQNATMVFTRSKHISNMLAVMQIQAI